MKNDFAFDLSDLCSNYRTDMGTGFELGNDPKIRKVCRLPLSDKLCQFKVALKAKPWVALGTDFPS
jgi:hypothetical protein